MSYSSCFGLGRIFHIGPIIALAVVFICYTVAVIDSMVWLLPPKTSFWGQINILVLTMWLGLILRNFFRAILGGPGYIPLGWKPTPESDSKYLQFCKVCQGYKPPRAHHCRVCGRCVMKMDHHCPWINNCCGHYNHTNFVLFVFFAPVGCLHSLIVCIATVYYQLFHRAEYLRIAYRPVHFSVHALLLTIFASGLAFGTIVAVGILFYYQMKNVIRNSTGIEEWIIEKAEDRRSESPEPMPDFIYPYNLGLKNNFLQIINMRCTPVGNGCTWPVARGCNQYTLTIEQLMQKKAKQERLVRFDVIHSYSGRWFPITKGLCTCLRFPCTDESRIALRPGEKLMVSRGNKYWLYGDKILDEESTKQGGRERGWFPRNCVLRTPLNELRDNGET